MDERRRSEPKTVFRGRGAPDQAPAGGDVLPALAVPILAFARRVEQTARPDPAALAGEVRDLVAMFETAGRRAGLPADVVLDARDALVTLIDARARNNPALPSGSWNRVLRAAVPVVDDSDGLRDKAAEAAKGGSARRDLARFLRHCVEAVDLAEAQGARRRSLGGPAWGWIAAGFVAVVLAGWGGWAEWRYRAGLMAEIPDVAAVAAAGMREPIAARAARLDGVLATVRSVEARTPGSPLGLIHRIGSLDAGAAARAAYAEAAGALAAEPLAEALDAALAVEGEPDAVYDTLRAWSIVQGRSAWQPTFLAGWIEARSAVFPDLAVLAPHVAALRAPPPSLPPPDPDALGQARAIAAEGSADQRAFLELWRAEATAALPAWRPGERVPDLAAVLIRRSGRPVNEGVPGLFTEAGWIHARDGGVEAAIADADRESRALIGATSAATPDGVLAELQKRTIARWTTFLSDLRVRPFTDQPTAVLISGTLARRNSPLAGLIAEVWREAGGNDRRRSHADQLRIAAEFGPAVQFVEQGRMAEISQLFAALNVTLAGLDRTSQLGREQLMDVQDRAASIVALQQAPAVVVSIIEDVLAQTAVASHAGPAVVQGTVAGAVPVEPGGDAWGAQYAARCREVVDGRYPFGDGPDADLAALAGAIGPEGSLTGYFRAQLADAIDTTQPVWRWKPEARLSGRSPESAVFFQKLVAIGEGLFAPTSSGFTVEALAQRGNATVSVGGEAAPVRVSAAAATLHWPGPAPAAGFQVAFDGDAATGRRATGGPFGILRFLDGMRVRVRDGGQRFLVDLKIDAFRVYMQLTFPGPRNPLSARALMRGLACPTRL